MDFAFFSVLLDRRRRCHRCRHDVVFLVALVVAAAVVNIIVVVDDVVVAHSRCVRQLLREVDGSIGCRLGLAPSRGLDRALRVVAREGLYEAADEVLLDACAGDCWLWSANVTRGLRKPAARSVLSAHPGVVLATSERGPNRRM